MDFYILNLSDAIKIRDQEHSESRIKGLHGCHGFLKIFSLNHGLKDYTEVTDF